MLEWYIEHHTLPVDVARMSVEDQRRRILFELEAPIPAGEPPRSSVRRPPVSSRVAQLQKRMTVLRQQMAAEPDGGRRLAIRDQLMELGRQIQAEQQSGGRSTE